MSAESISTANTATQDDTAEQLKDAKQRIATTVDFVKHLHRNNYIGRTESHEILKRLSGSDEG